MGVEATSAASERLWSTATSGMSAEHMEAIIRVHENLRRRGGFFQSGNARGDDASDSDNELHDVVDNE